PRRPSPLSLHDALPISDAIGNRLPWPESVRRRADQLTVELPAVLAPRSLDIKALNQPMTLEVADSLNLATGSRGMFGAADVGPRSEEHTSELQSRENLV